MSYVKLDCNILDSTLWVENSDTRVVFITMLAMSDQEGICLSTAPGIARRSNISIANVRKALSTLEAPDEDSRSINDNGRRIERIDGGYRIINYLSYRNKDHTAAARQRRHRAALREQVGNVTPVTRYVTEADTEADTYTNINTVAWNEFMLHRKEIKKPITPLSEKKNKELLAKYSHSDQQLIVDKSIASRWTGLFPIDGKKNGSIPPATDHVALDKYAADHGIKTKGCNDYFALRQRCVEAGK